MNRSFIFLVLASAQICAAQEGDLNDTVPLNEITIIIHPRIVM
jgi:hypothetical protein